MKELSKRSADKGIMRSKSPSGAAGKMLVFAGVSAMSLTVVASLLPFVGVFALGIVLVLAGAFMWE